jgi:hypothetical protein
VAVEGDHMDFLDLLMRYVDKFEDTKGIIRIRISKDRKYNGEKKSTIGQTTIYKIYI